MSAPDPYVFGERIEHAVAHQAARRPHAIAVRQGDRTLSYAELTDRSVLVAAALRELGVVPGQHIAVRMPRSPELVTALLGVLRTGAAYVAVDPEWPLGRVAEIVRGSAIKLIVTDLTGDDVDDNVRSVSLAELLVLGPTVPVPEPQQDGTATATVFYTSGSTGKPKGVLSPHRGTIRTLVNCPAIPVDQDSVFFQHAPLPWDIMSLELWAPLLNGGRCVLLEQTVRAVDAEALVDAIRQGVNSLWLTSSLFNVMAEERIDIFGGLRLLLVGGERVSVTSTRRVLRRYPDLHTVNGYGPAESSILTTTHVIRPVDIADDSTDIPIGTPVPYTTVMLLGTDGKPVANGEIGELAAGGDGVAAGYAGNPEETARRFFTQDGIRYYRTGDLALRDAEGLLRYRGRADNQVKIRGIRIEPGEVEAVLEAHPGITACCVVPLETAPGRLQLAAIYATEDGRPVDPELLRQHASLTLLDAMVPTLVHHVARLPRNANGKADRKAAERLLRELFIDDGAARDDNTVLGEVRALLGVSRLTESEDLLLAGASSLDAIRLAARVGARFGVRLTASDVYRLRTLDAITAFCATATTPAEQLPADRPGEPVSGPLSHAQQRFWLTEMASPGALDNMIVLAYSLTGPLEPEVLHAALNDVVALHPALRTTYPWVDDAPVQHVIAPAGIALERVGPPEAAAGIREIAAAVTDDWWRTPFSFEDEVPFRARLCRLADEHYLFCLHVHHIAFDGWSEEVFTTDLRTAYEARLAGLEPKADARLTYGQFGAWEATRLEHWAKRDLPFWQEQLDNAPPPFLPAPAGAATGSARRHELVLKVDTETVGGLSRAAARRGGPVLAALIAAAGQALARGFETDELVLGTVTAGRFDPALEPMVGFFVNPFAVTLTSASTSTVDDLLDQAATTVVSCLTHVHTPFDELVRHFAPSRERHPWFQAWVVLQATSRRWDLGGKVAVEPVRVRQPSTAMELMVEAIPAGDGSWELVLSWREDGISTAQAERLAAALGSALGQAADCA